MLKGDISNKTSPILAFNIDTLLFKEGKKNSGIKSALSRFLYQDNLAYDYFDRDINMTFVYAVNAIFNNYDFGIYLITTKLESQEQIEILEDLLYDADIYYTRLKSIKGVDELRREVDMRYMYYFDKDESILSMIGRNNAVHIKDISLHIKTPKGRKTY